jgi:hypothetical protein
LDRADVALVRVIVLVPGLLNLLVMLLMKVLLMKALLMQVLLRMLMMKVLMMLLLLMFLCCFVVLFLSCCKCAGNAIWTRHASGDEGWKSASHLAAKEK